MPKKGSDGRYYKCTFCVDRIQNGLAPACVEVCPTNVFTFGPAKEVMEKAKAEQAKGRYVYGLDLDRYVGGSVRWIYVASDRKAFAAKKHFEDMKPKTTEELRQILKPLTIYGGAALVGALTVLGFAAWRRSRVEEKREGSGKE